MIDFGKPITTRCGYPVEIWTTKAAELIYPVQGSVLIGTKRKKWGWTSEGCAFSYGDFHSDFDLINPPEEIEGWVNIYNEDKRFYAFELHNNREIARGADFDNKAIACIKIKFKEGDDL